MSFFDDASWVLIPEGIKEDVVYAQKPTNGLGDLAFTRASDATRTNSAGVIERTPWNLLQQSEMFSQSPWNINRISAFGSGSIVNDTIAPNGTLTADYIQQASGQTLTGGVFVQVSYILGQSYTLSVYAKKKENNYLRLGFAIGTGQVGLFGNFDLNTGVPGTPDVGVTQTIQDVGNGWYRCSITATSQVTTTSNTFIYNSSTLNSSTTTPLQGIYIWGAQLVEGTDAKPYFATTNRQDVPRLDYRNADGTLNSCPRLLLEPQRTNLVTFSEQFNNAAWGASVGITILADQGISPAGTNTMDLITFPLSATSVTQSVTVVSGSSYTFSVWLATQSGTQSVEIGNVNIGTWQAFTVTTTPQRFQVTQVASGTTRFPGIRATGAYSVLAWGAQLELGAYATTFIPTTTAAVTRLADAASKTGVSSLIGQTEGTLFFEGSILDTSSTNRAFGVSDGTTNNRIFINVTPTLNFRIITSGTATGELNGPSVPANTTFKVALAYANNDMTTYYNGSLVGTDSSVTIPACTDFRFDNGGGINNYLGNVSQAALFKTRLTNAQLAEITTL